LHLGRHRRNLFDGVAAEEQKEIVMLDEYALALERLAWLRAEAQAAHRLSQATRREARRRRLVRRLHL
jgi:hypothetical protein